MVPVSSLEANQLTFEGAQALSRIEENGVRVDEGYLNQTIKGAREKVRVLSEDLKKDSIYKTWQRVFGAKTKLGSRDQLGSVIFGELGYPSKKFTLTTRGSRTKKRYVADEEAFEGVDIPFIHKYFRIEKITNALDTWLLGIQRAVVNGRVHPTYNSNIVRTFRSSCNGPNFQNNPVRDPEIAEMVRRCYIPDMGDHFGETDYAQQEVRVGAFHHLDPNMFRYILDKSTDMHFDMAEELFLLRRDQIGRKTTRDFAKNMFVFPEFYGRSASGCAQDIWRAMLRRKPLVEGTNILVKDHLATKGITELGNCDGNPPATGTFEWHVKKVEDKLWNKSFPGYRDWKRRYYQEYQSRGWIRLPTGYVIRGVMGFTDVTNYSIQGSAYHCLIWSIIRLMKMLTKYKMKTKIIGEIHDSHQSNIKPKELNAFSDMCVQVMTKDIVKAWPWLEAVPLDVEVEVADIDQPWNKKREWTKQGVVWLPKPKK